MSQLLLRAAATISRRLTASTPFTVNSSSADVIGRSRELSPLSRELLVRLDSASGRCSFEPHLTHCQRPSSRFSPNMRMFRPEPTVLESLSSVAQRCHPLTEKCAATVLIVNLTVCGGSPIRAVD